MSEEQWWWNVWVKSSQITIITESCSTNRLVITIKAQQLVDKCTTSSTENNLYIKLWDYKTSQQLPESRRKSPKYYGCICQIPTHTFSHCHFRRMSTLNYPINFLWHQPEGKCSCKALLLELFKLQSYACACSAINLNRRTKIEWQLSKIMYIFHMYTDNYA